MEDSPYDLERQLFAGDEIQTDEWSGSLNDLTVQFNLRGSLAEALCNSGLFDDVGLSKWAAETERSYAKNGQHAAFISILSDTANTSVINHMLQITPDDDEILSCFKRDSGINLTPYYSGVTNGALEAFTEAAEQAILPALKETAIGIHSKVRSRPSKRPDARLRQIKNSKSYNDRTPNIGFEEQGQHLHVSQANNKNEGRHSLVARAVRIVQRKGVVDRVGNHDPHLGDLLEEYDQEFSKSDKSTESVLTLLAITDELQLRLAQHVGMNFDDEAISGDLLHHIRILINASNGYLVGFDAVAKYQEDMVRLGSGRRILDRAETISLSKETLTRLATSDIFSFEAKTLLLKLGGALNEGTTGQLPSLSVGTLKGAFRAMVDSTIEKSVGLAEDVIKDTAKDLAKDGILAAVKNPSVVSQVVPFVHDHAEQIANLAQGVPGHFAYLQSWLDWISTAFK